MVQQTQQVTITAEPAGMTANGPAYSVNDGSLMPHDGTIPNPVTITVNYAVKAITGEVYWTARNCSRCPAKNTHEGKPCIHQAAAIAKHIELRGDADLAEAKKRFGGNDDDGGYSPEALEGLERVIRQNHQTQWHPQDCDRAAVAAGLATEDMNFDAAWNTASNRRRFAATPLGTLVFDQISEQRDAAYRSSDEYQKRLARVRSEFGAKA